MEIKDQKLFKEAYMNFLLVFVTMCCNNVFVTMCCVVLLTFEIKVAALSNALEKNSNIITGQTLIKLLLTLINLLL